LLYYYFNAGDQVPDILFGDIGAKVGAGVDPEQIGAIAAKSGSSTIREQKVLQLTFLM
jgi:hypothetical protein